MGRLSSKDHRSHTTTLASLPHVHRTDGLLNQEESVVRGDSAGLESQHFGDLKDQKFKAILGYTVN